MTKQGFEYWFQWQVPVCAAILVIPAVVALKYIKNQKRHESVRSFHLWNSCWRTVNPLWLLLYRAFAFISLALILFNMVSLMGAFAFYFYTQWTFALVVAYFGLASVMSAHGCWVSMKKKKESPEEEFKEEIQCGSGCWGHLMLAMYQTCAGACVLTDLVFWCLLVPMHVNVQFQLTFLIVCLHTVNVVFLIGDTALNGLPFTRFGFANFVVWSCVYMGFQWLVHACGFTTRWPYPFLELDTPWAPLWYLGMALFHVPCYGIYALIFRAKNSLFPRLFPRAYVKTLN